MVRARHEDFTVMSKDGLFGSILFIGSLRILENKDVGVGGEW